MNFKTILEKAFVKRKPALKATEACRLFNGIADGLPGFTLDKYKNHYQIQFFSEDFLFAENEIVNAIQNILEPEFLVIKYRLSPSGKSLEKPVFKIVEGDNPKTIVRENNCLFHVDLTDTVNPGLFLDMREIRSDIEQYAKDKTVLNLFSYTCSFGVHAQKAGALKTVNVDISGKILEKGKQNYLLNHLDIQPGTFFKGNAFEYLKYAKKSNLLFDLIILDPPSFARFKGFNFNVRKDLKELVRNAAEILADNGVLMVSSNYSAFELNSFACENLANVKQICKNAKLLWKRTQSADFMQNKAKDSSLSAILIQNNKDF